MLCFDSQWITKLYLQLIVKILIVFLKTFAVVNEKVYGLWFMVYSLRFRYPSFASSF